MNFCSDRLIDIKELILLTGDSRTSAYEKMNRKSGAYDPDHPVGVRLGRKSVRYRLSEVLAYIASRPRVHDSRHERNNMVSGERPAAIVPMRRAITANDAGVNTSNSEVAQ